MAQQPAIVIVVSADDTNVDAVMTKLALTMEAVSAKSSATAPKVEGLLAKITNLGPAGAVGAAGISEIATATTSRLGPGSEAAAASLAKLDTKLGSMGGSAIAAGAAVAGIAVTALVVGEVVKKGTEAFLAYNDQVRRVTQVTHASAEDASLLVNKLKLLGISSDDVMRSFGILNASIDKGKFQRLGYEVKYAADGNVNFIATLDAMRAKMADSTNKTKADADAKQLLGRSYQTLGTYLNLTAEQYAEVTAEARKAAQSSAEDQRKALDLEIAQRALSDQTEKLAISIGREAVPALTDFEAALTSALSNVQDFAGGQSGAGKSVGDFLSGLFPVIAAVLHYGASQDDAAKKVAALAIATERATQDQKDYETALKSVTDAATSLAQDTIAAQRAALDQTRVTTEWEAQQAQKRADHAQAVADAAASEAAAEDTLNQARIDGAKAVADAEQHVRDVAVQGADAVAQAKDRVHQIEQKIAEDSRANVQDARSVADAERNLARVREDIASGKISGTDATRAEQDAETNLARQRQDQDTNEGKRAAQLRQDQADLAAARADVAKAEVKAAADVKKAREDLAAVRVRTEHSIEKAVQGVTDAEKALHKAQQTSATSAADLARHQLDVEAAVLANHLAHRKLTDDVTTLTGLVGTYGITWATVKGIWHALGVDTVPALRTQLQGLTTDLANAAAAASPLAPFFGVNTTTHATAGTGGFAGASGGGSFAGPPPGATHGATPSSITVHVNAAGIIADPASAHAIGKQVADGVHAALLAKQSTGVNLRLTGRG